MMTVTEFKNRFPEFEQELDNTINQIIVYSIPFFNVQAWADLYDEGLAYWVADRLVLSKTQATNAGSANNGMGSSVTVGDVSISQDSNAVQSLVNNPAYRSIYGQQYLYLSRLVGVGALAV